MKGQVGIVQGDAQANSNLCGGMGHYVYLLFVCWIEWNRAEQCAHGTWLWGR